ncbi:hypothetical protein Taro_056919 [Colocasia esculenta]|uniref:Uncharacterized protein n=1 Tax=Colocasia esculenta TaxID=4460 RepID=A0A843XV74_COLES|nr:hypothetical protein [Colocasia esculenta]
MRVTTGSTEIATVSCTGRDRLIQVGQQITMTGLSRSDRDRGHCCDGPCERGLSGRRVHKVKSLKNSEKNMVKSLKNSGKNM